MQLRELLDYIGGELLDDRSSMLEGVPDNIWSDAAIVRQLNEAQSLLCRRAWVLEDTDTQSVDGEGVKVCQLKVAEGQTDYPFHKSILKIKSIRLSDSDVDLLSVGYNDNRIRVSPFTFDVDFWDVNNVVAELSGRPSRWSADMGTRILRVRRKPDADTALLYLNLVVTRMPINALTLDNLDAEPEVPEEYHMLIARAAAGRLLQHPTVDSKMSSLGNDWTKEFDDECLAARKDRERRQQSQPQWRYGGWANDSYKNGWGC